MKTNKTFEQQVEAQQLIVNINIMRERIGAHKSDFNYLFNQTIEWLRNEQEDTIRHYKEALKNAAS